MNLAALDGGDGGVPLAIAIRDLALSVKSNRGAVPVLQGCSLNVPEGQLWMLLGPNGCGKSTLLKACLSLFGYFLSFSFPSLVTFQNKI